MAIEPSKEQREKAREIFSATGLDASEWLTWIKQYTTDYATKNKLPCPKCGGDVVHFSELTCRGDHGNDPQANHEIACKDCGTVFSQSSGYPGDVPLDYVNALIKDYKE